VHNLAAQYVAAPKLLSPDYLVNTFGLLGILAIIFAECGLLIGFFLPGDTLLFSAGLLVSTGAFHVPLWTLVVCVPIAAIAGNLVGYWIGYQAGPVVFNKPDSALFKQEHVTRAHAFFERWGPVAVVLARFVPIVRTFITVLAGAGRMRFSTYATYTVLGGALWGASVPLLGYYLGKIAFIRDHVEVILVGAVVVVVFFALLPVAYEVWRRRRAKAGVRTPDPVTRLIEEVTEPPADR
jgi:membrane-associated protein